MQRLKRYLIVALCHLLILTSVCAGAQVPTRRRDQFTREPGYYIIPFPYSLPGIGKGVVDGLSALVSGWSL